MASATLNPSETLETPLQEKPFCSRCGGDLDTTDYPKWCKDCRKTNKKQWEATRKEMTESRGFAAGVSAMRAYLAKNFDERYGTQTEFTGMEIAHIIRTCKGPDND